MSIDSSRFHEFSGVEAEEISRKVPDSVSVLERTKAFLIYESNVSGPQADSVKVGQIRDIRLSKGEITFRFAEEGRIASDAFEDLRPRLQITDWEMSRTHWSIKDGDIPQDVLAKMVPTPKKYDVVFSFAGEDRQYVERVAQCVNSSGIEIFYDEYEKVTLWGKDLAEHFDGVYRKQGRFCVMFISRHYAEKVWTRHERRSALARALEERQEYLLPARFDDTEIPGLRSTIGYLDLRKLTPDEFAELILQKLGRK
jgi:hypothetical protein